MIQVKKILLLSIFTTLSFITVQAQADLVFDKKFVECEDKWVTFDKGEEGTYLFGFIYIDEMAGLTFNREGSFVISERNEFVPKRLDSISIKARLQNNNVKVAIIPESRFDELGIHAIPDWLKYYKSDLGTAKRLQRWGYYYNDWGMSEKALEYLEPGYKLDPNYNGMAVELAFAYNALEKFDKAIPVLLKMSELTPKDGYIYKELSYAYLKTGKMEEAGIAAENGIKYYQDPRMQEEMAYNVAYQYYVLKDKKNFARWAEETKKWAKKGDQFYRTIETLESKMKE
jgi:tetratricopeptide (TPR) repeat protein